MTMNSKIANSVAARLRVAGAQVLVVCASLTPWFAGAQPGGAASGAAPAMAPGSAASAPAVRKWVSVPRVFGRVTAKELGVVINTEDPYSVAVGEYYVKVRGVSEANVLRLSLPVKSALTPPEFAEFSKRINQFYRDRVQGLALAWKQPYAVDCNAITGALALGFDPKACSSTCNPTRPSPYFGSASNAPWKTHHMRLSMLLAARDEEAARALIDRGARSDGSLGLRGAPASNVHFVTTSDELRSQRQLLFPPAGTQAAFGINVHLDQTEALRKADRVLMYLTGRATVDDLETVNFLPGALADHLTSFGGVLDKSHGQMTVLSWISAGATASYGTVSEPCAHLQKFPHPQLLLLFYLQGASALEAYWKSVAWPQQGLFVGDPLAAPFSRAAR